jgi:hypothetical protein
MTLQTADKVHVRGLEILRGQGDGKLHFRDGRFEVTLGNGDACRLIVPDPTVWIFLDIDVEEFHRFVLPAVSLEPAREDLDLELGADANRFIARGERLILPAENSEGATL